MPKTRVALYREDDGSCPFVKWFDELPTKVQNKCYLRLERLREMGHELRRPEADFLLDGINGLRFSVGGVHNRILYFFHGGMASVVSHGLSLKDAQRPVQGYVDRSAIGYITPKDPLAGRPQEIHDERDRRLEEARKQRQIRR